MLWYNDTVIFEYNHTSIKAVTHVKSRCAAFTVTKKFNNTITVVETYVYSENSDLFKRVSHKLFPLNEAKFYMILKTMYFDR